MNIVKISKDNHLFFVTFLAFEMCDERFTSSALQSFSEISQVGMEGSKFSGYLRIDSSDVKNYCSQESFSEELRSGIFNKVVMKIPNSISGDLNEIMEIKLGIYLFSFSITQYERDSAHNFEMIEDLNIIPNEEKIGRLVDLKIKVIE